MSQASDEEDAREIDELDKIQYIRKSSNLQEYFSFSFAALSATLVVGFFLLLIVIWLFVATHLIITFLSIRDTQDTEYLESDIGLMIILGILCIPASFFVLLIAYFVVMSKYTDSRSLIRFKVTQSGSSPLEYNSSVITALTDTLVNKRKGFGNRHYIGIEPESIQLDLIRVYLRKKYLRDVSVRDCLQLFSMVKVKIDGELPVENLRNCFFVMLDEKKGEVLFSSDYTTDWSNVRKDLEESGFLLSDVSEKTIDMRDYLIYRDGIIKRRKEGKEEGNTPFLQDSDMINV